MDPKIRTTFLLLVVTQGLHSIEEYFGKLWEGLPPATFLCSLVSDNLRTGFLIINTGLFIFGTSCWLLTARKDSVFTQILIWFWIVIEMINGIGHPVWALSEWRYEPGLATAPVLLILAIYLVKLMLYPDPKHVHEKT